MNKFFIISGFLGSGKTTLIKNIISKFKNIENNKIAIIENDFGEINTDSILLKNENITISEINAGCICCNIKGDFKASIKSLINNESPNICIIEPSGIAKTSEIKNALNDLNISSLNVCVVDINTAYKCYENFGEIFDDQVINADLFYLTKNENPASIIETRNLLALLKANPIIFTSYIDVCDFILQYEDKFDKYIPHDHCVDCKCHPERNCKDNVISNGKLHIENNHETNGSHHHDDSCCHNHCCEHDHHSSHEETLNELSNENINITGNFNTYTLILSTPANTNSIINFINEIIREFNIVRIKGFYDSQSFIEYDGNNIHTSHINSDKYFITIIGKNLPTNKIKSIWEKYE